MKKRITSLFLTVVIFVSFVSICAVGVSADEAMTASADAIRILKAEEGFSRKPYWDYAQWTVGYGTKCPDDKLDHYKENGITEEEAEALLRTYVTRFESELYKFINKTGVELNQNQFDALLLFSYNCGSAWSYDTDGGLYRAVIGGATGNVLIDAFSRWCNAGGQIKTFLLRRRLCEANIYLNGVYSQSAPSNYGYVLYDPCGGTVKPNVQGYDTELTAAIIPTPTYTGYTFEGWYTARVGGTKVTALDATTKNGRLYAHWIDGKGNDPAQDTAEGVTVTVTANDVNIRQGPGTNYKAVGTASTGEQLVITQTATGSGYTWGQFYGGWICLKYTNYDAVVAPKEEDSVTSTRMGTVKVSDQLRVRSGPSTGYSVAGYLKNGDRVEILEQKVAGSMIWGRISNGWISLSYVVLDPVEEKPEQITPPATKPEEAVPPATEPEETKPPVTKPEEEKPVAQTWTGTVKVKDFLRVRSGPSTSSKVVGYLSPNERVTITEKTTSGSMTWGKMSKGWISLDYVVMDAAGTTPGSKAVTGTVKVSDFLRVRKGPGTSYAIAGYLTPNAKVEITEQKKVGGTTWGKTSKGWISLDYVVLDKQSASSGASGNTTQTVTKIVTADCLRIRSTAGTSGKIVGYLYEGAKVTVLETKKVGNTTWGRISKGWISMDYVK